MSTVKAPGTTLADTTYPLCCKREEWHGLHEEVWGMS